MPRSSQDRNAGCGLFGWLLVIATFVVLRWTGVISWSWSWVLTPLWVMLGLMVAIMAVYALLLLVGVGAFQHWLRRSRLLRFFRRRP